MIQNNGGKVYRMSPTSRPMADGSGYLTTLPSVEQSIKSANQGGDPIRVVHCHRSVQARSFPIENEKFSTSLFSISNIFGREDVKLNMKSLPALANADEPRVYTFFNCHFYVCIADLMVPVCDNSLRSPPVPVTALHHRKPAGVPSQRSEWVQLPFWFICRHKKYYLQ